MSVTKMPNLRLLKRTCNSGYINFILHYIQYVEKLFFFTPDTFIFVIRLFSSLKNIEFIAEVI